MGNQLIFEEEHKLMVDAPVNFPRPVHLGEVQPRD